MLWNCSGRWPQWAIKPDRLLDRVSAYKAGAVKKFQTGRRCKLPIFLREAELGIPTIFTMIVQTCAYPPRAARSGHRNRLRSPVHGDSGKNVSSTRVLNQIGQQCGVMKDGTEESYLINPSSTHIYT